MSEHQHLQSNRRTRIYLDAIAEVIGQHGLHAVLRLANLEAWIETPPDYNDELAVSFADFARLNHMLEEMYGPRGGRALALRAGRAAFHAALEQLGGAVGLAGAAFKLLPPRARLKALLDAIIKGMSKQSTSQTYLTEDRDALVYHVKPCPACWGRDKERNAICHSTVGFLMQALEWAGLADEYEVEETACAAVNEELAGECVFALRKV